ncbi:MAG: hypothetical protein ACOX3K_00225 [Bacilli bacterium]|jgi:hypothetical protein
MVNLFLAMMFLLSSMSLFSYQYRFMGIHRTFLLLNHGVIDQGVVLDQDMEQAPFFSKIELEKAVNDYLRVELAPYTSKYKISFYYYDLETETYCFNDCRGVQIHLMVDLVPMPMYSYYQNFKIESRYE